MEEEISRKPVTPIGDFNCQSFPLIEGKTYPISEEELAKLGKHELKWSEDEEGHTILIPNDPTEENTRNLAVQRIAELKKYLSDTDYIVTKIAEAETEEEKSELKTEYQAKLVLRKRWRKDINELQEYLNEESHID
jgi:hypothetical protein